MPLRRPSGFAKRLARRAASFVLVSAMLIAPCVVMAQPAAGGSEVSSLEVERHRLRTALDQAHAEIAGLKRKEGVRSDYRLRQRMADAEALARKLVQVEAQLRRLPGGSALGAKPVLTSPPAPVSADGPLELEAKADLMADQARRLSSEAEGLARTADRLRTRQILRRRAGQLERDPFGSLDAAKRTMVFGGPQRRQDSVAGGATTSEPAPTSPKANLSADTASRGSEPAPSAPSPSPAPTAPPQAAGAPASAPPPPTAPPAEASGPSTASGGSAEAPAPTPTSSPSAPSTDPGVVAPQLRTLLDPATLADIQRLERSGRPLSDAEALDKAAASLRRRAAALSTQAQQLRARARTGGR